MFDISLDVALGILTSLMVGILMLSIAILHTVMVEENRIKQEVKKAGKQLEKDKASKPR